MKQIIDNLQAQFPILSSLRVATKDSPIETEPIPLYLGILLAAMNSRSKAPICFILPRREKTALMSAILIGLIKFMDDLDRQTAETKFTPNQNVFVRPPNKVYRYQGVHTKNPALIELGIIGKTDWQTFPLSDIRRLEVTEATRPAGKLGNIPKIAPQPPIDELLGIDSSGSFKALSNHVLFLDFQNNFKEVVMNTLLQQNTPKSGMPPLGELLPFGVISTLDNASSGRFKKWNFLSSGCDPLVAVTSSQETMVAACRAADPHSKVVIVNGLALLANHPQAYDEIAATQHLVIIAEHDEQDQMQKLGDRGCKFWWLGHRELSMEIDGSATAKVFGGVFRAAKNEATMKVESEICEDQFLNEIAVQLLSIKKDDETEATSSILKRSYSLLNEVASLFQAPTSDESRRFSEQLSVIRRSLEADRHWIGSSAKTIAGICSLFDSLFSADYRLGEKKGDLLRQVCLNIQGKALQLTAILARNPSQVKQLEAWSQRFGFRTRVFTCNTMPEDGHFDRVVCAAWPGSYPFQQMARLFLAPCVTVIGYPFEIEWLKQCHRKLRERPHLPALTQTEKSELFKNGMPPHIVWAEDPENIEADARPAGPVFPIWEFEKRIGSVRKGEKASLLKTEETITAKYVGFRGESYAYITETHELPIVTDLLAARDGSRQTTPMKRIEQVRVGDFAVFRDGGERDVIQTIADKKLEDIGQDAIQLRKRANLWRDELRASGISADEILTGMIEVGSTKSLPTIRNWLYNDSMIGPGSPADLDLIAKLTQSKQLEISKHEVWDAIKRLRSEHLSAGMRLTAVLLQKLPSCLKEIEEDRTRINVDDIVNAWVVQVDDISSHFEEFPGSSVNRLLLDSLEPAADLLF